MHFEEVGEAGSTPAPRRWARAATGLTGQQARQDTQPGGLRRDSPAPHDQRPRPRLEFQRRTPLVLASLLGAGWHERLARKAIRESSPPHSPRSFPPPARDGGSTRTRSPSELFMAR